MNSSSASDAARTVHGCDQAISQGSLDHTTLEAYAWLVFVTVISIIISPITFALNALILIAVKTKHRVKTKSNLPIACLSSTDGIMGVIGQPLFISWVIAELQGNTSSKYCMRTLLSRIALRVLGIASLSHLAMMNVERYIAIKHPLEYETIVTENRLTCLSVLLWIAAILLTVPLSFVDNNIYLTVDNMQYHVFMYGHYFLLSNRALLRNTSASKRNRCPASIVGNQREILKGEKSF